MNPLAELLTCLRFFSRLPLPPARGDGGPGLADSVRLLPVAGGLLGAAQAAVLWVAILLGLPPALGAAAALLAGTALTGGLHEDGLADTADGFGGGRTRERKLAIMRDSRIGTYGVLAIAFSLALRWASLDALVGRGGWRLAAAGLIGAGALSRPLALVPLALLGPARADGLGHGVGRPGRVALSVALGIGAAAALLLPLWAGAAPHAALLAGLLPFAAAAATVRLADRQIGGHTGDVAGAAQQVAEAACLVGLLIRPGAP